jgi:hypothetical protein
MRVVVLQQAERSLVVVVQCPVLMTFNADAGDAFGECTCRVAIVRGDQDTRQTIHELCCWRCRPVFDDVEQWLDIPSTMLKLGITDSLCNVEDTTRSLLTSVTSHKHCAYAS